jgi:fluoroacetyl-CoA thioesterase
MRDTLAVGLEGTATHTVTAAMAPGHLPRVVLSTPAMIGLIEGCCLQTAQPHLDDGETTVGTHVCVSHSGAVLDGETFEVRVRLAEIVKRRLNFEVTVVGPRGAVSEGTHQRAVVSLDRMG